MTEQSNNQAGGPRWYVVRSKPQAENMAAANLRHQGFEVYLPLALMMDRKTKQPVGRPLFPRYLFVRLDLTVDQWRAIFSTKGVQCLFCSGGGHPIAVGEACIANIRVRETDGIINMVEVKPARVFVPGERVRIDDGELEGIFCEHVDDKRVLILLNILGRESRAITHSARLS